MLVAMTSKEVVPGLGVVTPAVSRGSLRRLD